MTRRGLIVALVVAALAVAGCAKGDSAATAESESPLPKTPNATAADNARNLQHANMPESAKKIMGGASSGAN